MRVNGHDRAADDRASRYCMAALDRAADSVRSAGPGSRNATLNEAAFGMAQLVSTGGVSESTIREELGQAAQDAGLDQREIATTLRSAINKGMAEPRALPPPDVLRHGSVGSGSASRKPAPPAPRTAASASRKPSPRQGLDIEAYLARCTPAAGEQGYVVRKGGAPDGLLTAAPLTVAGRNVAGELVVPAYDLDGNLQTCQFIPAEQGPDKLSAPGHQIGGAVFVVGAPDGRPSAAVLEGGMVYLVEGIATGWTVHQNSSAPALVTFGKGNLERIAKALRGRHPDLRIIIVPDVGGEHQAAAIVNAIGAPAGWVEMPDGWGANSDLNDLVATEDGEQLVREVLASVREARAPEPRFKLKTVGEICARPYPQWIIPDLIPAAGTGVMYGESGSGKSFSILDLAISLSLKRPWAGRRTRQALVVYVVLEGSLRVRLDAWLKHHGMKQAALTNFMAIDDVPMNLLTDGEADQFVADLRAQLGQYEHLVIIIDTLARAMPGGNENASEDMGRLIANVDTISKQLGALSILVHHSGKDATRGARGWSGLKAAMDMEIETRRDGDDRTLTFSKVKDGQDGITYGFKLEVVDLGLRRSHDPDADITERITSCVAVMGEQTAAAARAGKDPVMTNAFLAALRAQGGKAHKTDFRKLLTDGDREKRLMSTSTFYFVVKELERQKKLESGLTHYLILEDEQ